jgi:pimeloyl-ACP methyl ester carboxylesterase
MFSIRRPSPITEEGQMESRVRLRSALVILAATAGALLIPAAAAQAGGNHHKPDPLPIVFVHGGAGSAQQYESVAKRFASNGYPQDRIRTYEYNSASIGAIVAAPAQIDALVDELRAEYDVDRVNLVGHSLGTTVSGLYLGQDARAAKIAHYVGVDGASNANCGLTGPNADTLDCMGIFAGSAGNVGGNNVYFNGEQTHVEAATSEESFAAQHEFFTGDEPETTKILPEPPGEVEISGRAVDFPANAGVDGGTVELWEVNAATGARKFAQPAATFDIGASGNWGPVSVNGQQQYEFALTRPGTDREHHLYFQPFIRDDHWVRLLTSPPGSAIPANTNTGPNHSVAVVVRNREWWTTHPTGRNDGLTIATTQGSGKNTVTNGPHSVFQNVTANNNIGLHVHDAAPGDGLSSLSIIPFFQAQAFQTGVDVFMPAATPANGVISFRNVPRGDASSPQVLNIPNRASDVHSNTVQFNDYVQAFNTWAQCKGLKPSPCQ